MNRFFPSSAFVVIAILFSASFSVWLEGRQAARAALRYIGIWETEIARSLLMHERTEDVEKLLAQIEEVHPALRMGGEGRDCAWPVTRTISLYALPAKDIVVCRDPSILVGQGLLSPTFFGLMLAFVALFSVFLRREHQQEIRRLAAEARAESESRLVQLSREVAHDIRGPLSALHMIASHAASISGEEKDLLLQASARIDAIADHLLRRSRTAEALPEEPAEKVAETIAIDGVISLLEAELVQRFPYHRIEFSLRADVSIMMGRTDLHRVISNLVQNAVDASVRGAEVLIATRASSEEVTLVVSDQGRGIPRDILARLGREEVTSGKPDGNGLGILSAKRAIESAGGTFSIHSREGVGTQVKMKFLRSPSLKKRHDR